MIRPGAHRPRSWSLALLALALVSACGRKTPALQTLKEQACACQDVPCARRIGQRISEKVLSTDLDEASARLAAEATRCLARLGE